MEFFILRDIEATFVTPTITANGLIERNSDFLETEISAADTNDGADLDLYTEQLTSSIIEDLSEYKTKTDTLDWQVRATISLPNPTDGDGLASSSEGLAQGTIGIYPKDDKECNFLGLLEKIFNESDCPGGNVSVNISIDELNCVKDSTRIFLPVDLNVTGLQLEKGFVKGTLDQKFEQNMLHSWRHDEHFSCRISVSIVLNSIALSKLDAINLHPESSKEFLKKMLDEAICWDTQIVVEGLESNKTGIKCHRSILATKSRVFRTMFESGMKEATENKIEMEGISESGVRALLAYLYYMDTTAIHQSSKIALELLQAAEKYEIKGLRNSLCGILKAKEGSWFEVDVVLTLYMFTKAVCATRADAEDRAMETSENDKPKQKEDDRDMNTWTTLKLRSLRVLKWYVRNKYKPLLDSVMYKEIFSGNPKLAMELSRAMIRLD